MSVRVRHTVDRLDRDLTDVSRKAAREMARIVRDNAKDGNRRAKAFARSSAGKHGKHYPDAFTAEALGPFEWEYGPDASKPQGGMKFEHGEGRQTAPHLDLNKSADVIGPRLGEDVRDLLDRLFWS